VIRRLLPLLRDDQWREGNHPVVADRNYAVVSSKAPASARGEGVR
jgi:hypothetical protein